MEAQFRRWRCAVNGQSRPSESAGDPIVDEARARERLDDALNFAKESAKRSEQRLAFDRLRFSECYFKFGAWMHVHFSANDTYEYFCGVFNGANRIELDWNRLSGGSLGVSETRKIRESLGQHFRNGLHRINRDLVHGHESWNQCNVLILDVSVMQEAKVFVPAIVGLDIIERAHRFLPRALYCTGHGRLELLGGGVDQESTAPAARVGRV